MPSTNSWYEIKALANGSAEIFIFEEIGLWGITAKRFIDDIKALGDVKEILLRINSPGGSVFDGMAMYNLLKSHPANVTVRVEGVAASMASVIMCAGNRVIVPENALVMIHNPMGGVYGDEEELRKVADVMAKVKAAIVSAYVARTGRTEDEVAAWMNAETWFTGAEAVEFGFADETDKPVALAACAHRAFANYQNTPASLKAMAMNSPTTTAVVAANTGVTTMPQAQPSAKPGDQTTTVAAKSEAEIRAEVMAQEQGRRQTITARFGTHATAHAELLRNCLDDMQCTPEAAADRLLNALGAAATPTATPTRVSVVTGSAQLLAHAEEALAVKANLIKPADVSKNNGLRGYTLAEMARALLEAHGVGLVGVDRLGMVGQAFTHSSGDFGRVLGNVAHRALLFGYDNQEQSFRDWTIKGTLSDFRPADRVGLDGFPLLDKVPEGGEYKYATLNDRGETIQLATYGKLFSITRQAIINDDLSVFTEVPQKMGQAAYRTLNRLVYAVLSGTHKMADGKTLFHADHKNIAVAAAPSVAALGAAKALMRKQKDSAGAVLNVRPGFVIAPVALEDIFRSLLAAEYDPAQAEARVPNPVRNMAEVIADAELDEVSTSAWYLVGGRGYDTIEVAYLDGDERPRLEQKSGWTVDGVEFKVSIDAGVKARDHRPFVKNEGQ